MYNFRQYETIRSFGDKIYTSNINIDDAEMDESSLLKISQNLIINLDQEQQKVKIKKRYL